MQTDEKESCCPDKFPALSEKDRAFLSRFLSLREEDRQLIATIVGFISPGQQEQGENCLNAQNNGQNL